MAISVTDDIDSLDAAFVPGTGWPEPGGLLPREAHKLVGGVAKEGLCGMELVEVRDAPCYLVQHLGWLIYADTTIRGLYMLSARAGWVVRRCRVSPSPTYMRYGTQVGARCRPLTVVLLSVWSSP